MLNERGEYSIVPLKAKDAGELADLEAACFSSAWSAEQYRALLGGVESALQRGRGAGHVPPFLALGLRFAAHELAAYITLGLHAAGGELEVYNIAVQERRRRLGLGRALLDRALEVGARLGLSRALLEVRTGNTAALALYAAAGFTCCGRRKGYYPDTGEDALVLERGLGPTDC